MAIIVIFGGGFGASLFPTVIANAGADVISSAPNKAAPNPYYDLQYFPVSGSGQNEDLEDQMQEVFKELRKLEDMFKKKMNQEVLPRIQKEIERLKEWLEKYEKKEDQKSPRWTNLELTPRGEPDFSYSKGS